MQPSHHEANTPPCAQPERPAYTPPPPTARGVPRAAARQGPEAAALGPAKRALKVCSVGEALHVNSPASFAQTMEPDDHWDEPEPPQSAGFGEDNAEEWAHESCESRVSGGGDAADARDQFVMSMRRMGYTLGTAVKIFGLRVSPEHNGKHGKIVGFDHEAVRIRVLLDRDLTTLSLKAANLERNVVAQAHADARPVQEDGIIGPGAGSDLARGGVGLVLKAVVRGRDNVLMVKSITEGSPAQSSCINVGDCLVSVDGKSVRTIYQASEAILGDYGSAISMVLERMNDQGVWARYSLQLHRGRAAKLPMK